MSAQSFCSRCGTAIPSGAAFCPGCGQAVGPAPPPATAPARSRRRGRSPLAMALIIGLLLCVGIVALPKSGANTATPGAAATAQPTPDYSAARYVDPRALASDPASYRGVNLWLQGQALGVEQHASGTWVQLMAQPTGKATTESIVVTFDGKAHDLIKGQCYQIYAIGDGTTEVTRTLTGATNTVPAVRAYRYGSTPSTTYGCAAPTSP